MSRPWVRGVLGAAALLSVAALGWAYGAGSRLYYDGKVVSTGVIVKDGTTYVPLRDVASAMALTVEPRGDGYALVHPGGGMQMEGLNGKIGDDLFNGYYRLKVLSVARTAHYKRQLSPGGDIDAPDGQDVVAVTVRVKNGTPKKQFLMVFGNPASLTDEDEHSYDMFSGDSHARNVDMLPGSAVDTVLTFFVPKNAVVKDLIYKVDCQTSGPAFRVSLKQP